MPQNWQNVSVTLKYRDQIGRNKLDLVAWFARVKIQVLIVADWSHSDLLDGWDTAHAVPVGSGSCMLELQPARLG